MADSRPAGVRRVAKPTPGEDACRHLAWIIGKHGGPDVHGRARHLLTEFGSLGAVLAASATRLSRADGGVTTAYAEIGRFNAAASHVLLSRIIDRPVLGCWQQVHEYLRFAMSGKAHETFRVLHLDARNALMEDELVSEGSGTRTPVSVRAVVARGIEMGSASLILAHNHPSGDPAPSASDVDLTNRIVKAARALEIDVIDHLIVGSDRVFSFRLAGLLT
ncbi:JAB domain-containing protein [Sphingomonas faeni]|uniref:JAB domain-containing protein n=1 Tax=Sphingomonas faeni TaxID=185950 RepID=UPI00335650A7